MPLMPVEGNKFPCQDLPLVTRKSTYGTSTLLIGTERSCVCPQGLHGTACSCAHGAFVFKILASHTGSGLQDTKHNESLEWFMATKVAPEYTVKKSFGESEMILCSHPNRSSLTTGYGNYSWVKWQKL